MDTHDVVVVGGGIAGLVAGAYACRDGRRVLLYEQQPQVGGLVNSFVRNGFVYDQGIRSIESSGIVFPMLRQLGIDLEFVHSTVSLGVADNMIAITDTGSLQAYEQMLGSLYPGHEKEIAAIIAQIRAIMGYMDVLYGIDNPLFLDNFKDLRYVVSTLLPWLLKYRRCMPMIEKLNEPVDSYLRRFTTHQPLIDIIAQHFFARTPTFFALSYFSLYLDYQYPKGGTGSFTRALARYIEEHGGEIRTSTRITALDVDRHELMTADGAKIPYGQLVWAADMKTLHRYAGARGDRELEQARGGDSILTLYLATDLPPSFFASRASAHVFHTPRAEGLSTVEPPPLATKDMETWWQWVRTLLSFTTYEIAIPVLRDPALAPEGKTGLIISALFDYMTLKEIERFGWYEQFKELAGMVMTAEVSHSLYPGLQDHVIERFVSTPLTIERLTGNSEGAITGWAFTNENMPAVHEMKQIMKSVTTPFEDVWQAGQWTFSPSGLPISVLTGRLAAKEAVKRLRKHT